jgi:hypothetical protein
MNEKLDRFKHLRGQSSSIEDRHRAKLLEDSRKNPLLPNILRWLADRHFRPQIETSVDYRYLFDASLIGFLVISLDLLAHDEELSKAAASEGAGPSELQELLDGMLADMLDSEDFLQYDLARLERILNEVARPYPELTLMIEIGSAALMHRMAKEIDAQSE